MKMINRICCCLVSSFSLCCVAMEGKKDSSEGNSVSNLRAQLEKTHLNHHPQSPFQPVRTQKTGANDQKLPQAQPNLHPQHRTLPPIPSKVSVSQHSDLPEDPIALYELGMQYKDKAGLENDALYVKCISLASDKRIPNALFEMGILHATGDRGIQQNYLEAYKLWEMAGDHVGCLFEIAQLLEVGHRGVPQDKNRAIEYYEKSIVRANKEAFNETTHEYNDYWSSYRLEAMRRVANYKVNSGASWVISDGWKLYEDLCLCGDPESLFLLGSMATQSSFNNTKEEFNRGLRRLEQAADQKYCPAIHLLGKLYENGVHPLLARNLEKARLYYQTASDLNHVEAYNDLQAFDKKYPHLAKK